MVREPEFAFNETLHKPFVCNYDSIFPLSSIQFEDFMFPAPADPHKDLTEQFGDYMSFPRGRLTPHLGKTITSRGSAYFDELLEKLHDIERFFTSQI